MGLTCIAFGVNFDGEKELVVKKVLSILYKKGQNPDYLVENKVSRGQSLKMWNSKVYLYENTMVDTYDITNTCGTSFHDVYMIYLIQDVVMK